MPAGVERMVVPAAAGAWIAALEEYGTMSFEQVVPPAPEMARDGFPLQSSRAMSLDGVSVELEERLSTADVCVPGAGRVDRQAPPAGGDQRPGQSLRRTQTPI